AAVAAEILANGGFAGKKPVLTGPEALSFKEIAHVLSNVLGRDVEHVAGTDDEAWERLRRQGQPPWLVSGQIALYGYWGAGGPTAKASDTVVQLTGRPPRSVEEFARDYDQQFLDNSK